MSSSPDMTPEEGFNRTALQAAKESGSSQEGKWFLVTGAYSGIGVETTVALLEVGGSVIVGGRNLTALEAFVQELQEKYGEDRIYGYGLDLADLSSAKRFCDGVLASCNSKENNNNKTIIDVVILNAGVMATPCGTTKDGFEMQIGTNVIGHFLVAKLLAPITKRQVWLSSSAHTRNDGQRFDIEQCKDFNVATNAKSYDPFHWYQQSKIGDTMLAKEFPKRYPSIEAVSVHPGVIKTNLGRHISIFQLPALIWRVITTGQKFKTPQQGAATTITVALAPTIIQGAYYADCTIAEEAPNSKIETDLTALFDYCDEVTKSFQ